MKIVSLLENTPGRPDMETEHGLSLYIETRGRRLLFDMGQTDLFIRNAARLGIDLSAVDTAVISHGHNDHGGGLEAFLAVNDHAPVFIHQDAFTPHYNGAGKYIGLEPSLCGHPRLRMTGDRTDLGDGMTLMTCNGLERPNSLGHFGLTEQVGDTLVPDDFRHEQYLLIREGDRRFLISGCTHKGILDVTEWFAPDVLVGGFHVSKMPLDGGLDRIAKTLNTYPTLFYTCHCTGEAQFAYMQARMPKLRYLACGQSVTI
jgi:7,8-dihydropterin-6-yl-methyl-4-(beta-D-ribofuranosyl)aminobenzene 5'-phosphate synthase